MNGNAVISRASTRQKLAFGSELVMPRFSILDPETTYTLPDRQTANGVVDTMVHVFEQYLTRDVGNPLNEGIAEAILRVTIAEGRKVFASPRDYGIRANLMWSATMALNGIIGVNAAHDWVSHGIGHELTAFHGLDHGQTLAVVSPNILRYKKDKKKTMLARYARNVWGVTEKDEMAAALAGVDRTAEYWRSIGVKTSLKDYGVGPENFAAIADRLGGGGRKMGENGDIGREDVLKILGMCL
jgi:NADP-dependent alcohol dehydrogenase